MLKQLWNTLSSLVLIGMLVSACQPAVPTKQPFVKESAAPTQHTDDRIKLRWFIGVGTGRTSEAVNAAKSFVERYNSSQDKVELELEVVTSSTHDAIDQLNAEIKAGDPPDIVAPADMGWAGEQLTGYALYLDDYLAGYDLTSIDLEMLDSWGVDGKLVGLPAGVFTSVIFYNKALFDAANLPYPPHKFGEPYADGDPWTVEKMEEIALQLTLDANGNNAAAPDFVPERITQWGFHWQWDSTRSMAVMFGTGEVVDADGNAAIPQQWWEAFHWYYDGMWEKHFIPTRAQVNTTLMGNAFASSKVAMVHYYTFYSQRMIGVPGWDIAAVPSYKGTTTTRMERDGIFVLNTTQYPAESVEIAYAIATDPDLLLAWEMLPAFKDIQAQFMEGLMAKHPGVDWQVMLDSKNYADTTYENTMPNYRKSYDRLLEFLDMIGTSGNLSLDDEIGILEADLQILFEEAP